MTISESQSHVLCPVCSSGNVLPAWVVNGFEVARCLSCTNRYVRNKISSQDLSRFYEQPEVVAYSDSNAECLRYYYRKLAGFVRDRHPHPGRILDVGCSRGFFLDELSDWECYGTEINSHDAAYAKQRCREVYEGNFEDMQEAGMCYDVITFQDVLDHFADPFAAIEKAYRLLKPGGLLAVKVHDFSCLYAKIAGPHFYAVTPPFHLFYFTRKGMALLLGKAGFETVRLMHIGHILQLKIIFFRLSQGNAKSLAHRIYLLLDKLPLGRVRIKKNLRDIMTVFAIKPPLGSVTTAGGS